MAMQTLHLKQHYGMGVGSESVHVWCWGQLKPFSMEHPSSGDRQFTKQPETTEEQRNHGVFTVLIPGNPFLFSFFVGADQLYPTFYVKETN
ncbi:hypothetical protein ERO13_D04G092200v2 [Gossypium hirsutum]|uniref:Uncharacterized protein n=2 Tax=Gossypium TaxID=3633 RepID=A0A5J5RU86_GOSBA|nr:hypothetical protein ES319_D04G108600v1 [Gossypium barbadense]KAG4151954.1 hypothetical protein ERO13_D04G092200v2 [Gossypium hirsutum]TYG73623.1 hypothetical protein ES288_D04G116000v1 [Gossypium darwinii]